MVSLSFARYYQHFPAFKDTLDAMSYVWCELTQRRRQLSLDCMRNNWHARLNLSVLGFHGLLITSQYHHLKGQIEGTLPHRLQPPC